MVSRTTSLWVIALGTAGMLFATCSRSAKETSPAQAIDALMTELSERGYFSGAVVVGRGDEILYEGGFGNANVEEGVPFTPETPTDGASMAKTLSSAAILTLQAEGRLELDDPAAVRRAPDRQFV